MPQVQWALRVARHWSRQLKCLSNLSRQANAKASAPGCVLTAVVQMAIQHFCIMTSSCAAFQDFLSCLSDPDPLDSSVILKHSSEIHEVLCLGEAMDSLGDECERSRDVLSVLVNI